MIVLCAAGIAASDRGAYADPGPDIRETSAREALRDAAGEDDLTCARELAPHTWWLSSLPGDLQDQLERRFEQCRSAAEKRYKRIRPGGCRLKVPGAISTTAAPRALIPRGAKAACVALVPGTPGAKTAGSDDDPAVVCPRVELVWSGGARRHRALAFEGGPLADTLWCCNLDSVAAGTLDGRPVVRISGGGHPCGGGTALETSDAVYSWNGTAFAEPLDLSIGYH